MDTHEEFPVTQRWAFLNHANVAPLSRRAQDAIRRWTEDIGENGDAHLDGWFREIETVRAAAARLLGATPGEVAFLKNTSEGIALVAEGFPWRPGDTVLLVEGEYPANVYPWLHLRDKGVQVKTVPCRGARITADDLAAAMDARTRLLSISFVQFSTGFRCDLAAIGEVCRQRGVDFCVDAIQGLGVFPVDVKRMGINYLAANSHKWLLSPQGAAIFYIGEDRLEKIRPTSVGWKSVADPHNYSMVDFRLKPDASRFECGSFIVPSIVALGASLSLIDEVGVLTIRDKVKAITDYLTERLHLLKAQVASPRDGEEWSGIVSFLLPGKDPAELVRRCADRQVVVSCRAARLRASPHFYNNCDDVDRLIAVLRES